jgi:DNA repair exonuclease SbcCD ATPase subunit
MEASARAAEATIPFREAQTAKTRVQTEMLPLEQGLRTQASTRSALNTEFNFNDKDIQNIDREMDRLGKLLPQTDADEKEVETAFANLDSRRKALLARNNQLQQQLRSGQQFAPPAAQQGTPITATTQQQAVDALQQLGLSADEINSYQQGISKLPTTQTTTQPLAVQATPTATATPEATRNPLAGLMGRTTRANASGKQLQESAAFEEAVAKIAPEYITKKTKYDLAEDAYGKLKQAFAQNNPAATNGAITEFIRSLDDSVVQKGDRESFMRGVVTKKAEMLAYANSWLGRSVDLPPEAKQRIEDYAKLARDYYQKSEEAAQVVALQLIEDRNKKIRNTSFNKYWNGDPDNGVLDLVTANKLGVPFGTKMLRRP